MSDTTLETPHSLGPGGQDSSPPRRNGSGGGSLLQRSTWWLVGIGVVVVSAIVLRWANTRPGYDPYGWLDWGYHTLHGTLNLGGAPSWKPFTFVFTVVYSLFGHWALYLWMLTAVSISLSGAVFGGRIAYRLTAREGGHWWAAWAAGAVRRRRGARHPGLLPLPDERAVGLDDRERLPGGDRHVPVRPAALGLLAGRARRLGRPEVWPFLAVYGIFLIRKHPNLRKDVIGGAVLTLFFWFGVPTITNGRPNIAGQLALRSPRECTTGKITCTINRFTALDFIAIQLAACSCSGWRCCGATGPS